MDEARKWRSDVVVVALWFLASLVSDGLALTWAGTAKPPFPVVVVLAVLGVSTYLLAARVILRVSRISVGLPGARLVFAAFVLHVVSQPLYALTKLLLVGLRFGAPTLPIAVSYLVSAVLLLGIAASPASGVCLSVGLLKARLVPSWVPWSAMVSAGFAVASLVISFLAIPALGVTLVQGNGLQVLQRLSGGVAEIAELVFVAALGVTLFWKRLTAGHADGVVVATPDTEQALQPDAQPSALD